MSRKVSPKGGIPDRGLLTRHSRCLGSYALFVFLGRVSCAPCAKSSTSRAARRSDVSAAASGGGTRLEGLEEDADDEEDADSEAGGDSMAREGGWRDGEVGGPRRGWFREKR